jgi:hypothetical protein
MGGRYLTAGAHVNTTAGSWTPDASSMDQHPELVVARRDPGMPGDRDTPRLFATRLLEAAVANEEEPQGAVDFPLPCALGHGIGQPVRFRSDDEPTVRRTLVQVVELPVDGSSLEWEHFSRINLRFAAKTASLAPLGASILVIADGLYLVPRYVRRLRPDVSIMVVLLEELPGLAGMVRSPAAVQVMLGMLGADVVWCASESEASRFEVAAIALDLAQASGRSIVHFGRAVELRAG